MIGEADWFDCSHADLHRHQEAALKIADNGSFLVVAASLDCDDPNARAGFRNACFKDGRFSIKRVAVTQRSKMSKPLRPECRQSLPGCVRNRHTEKCRVDERSDRRLVEGEEERVVRRR